VSTDTSARLASRAARSAWTGLDWTGQNWTDWTGLKRQTHAHAEGPLRELKKTEAEGSFPFREELQPAGRAVVLPRPEMLLIRAS